MHYSCENISHCACEVGSHLVSVLNYSNTSFLLNKIQDRSLNQFVTKICTNNLVLTIHKILQCCWGYMTDFSTLSGVFK